MKLLGNVTQKCLLYVTLPGSVTAGSQYIELLTRIFTAFFHFFLFGTSYTLGTFPGMRPMIVLFYYLIVRPITDRDRIELIRTTRFKTYQ